jgi:hypothetical protein
MKDLIKRILREEKKKLFIPRKLSPDDSRYTELNNKQPIKDGIQINQYDHEGRKQGYWEEYYDNGILESKGSYKNDIRDGIWEYYRGDGQLESKGSYKNDKKDRIWEYYYDNGKLSYKRSYKNGIRDGIWEYYYDNGKLRYKGSYKNGKYIKKIPLTESKQPKNKLFIPRRIDDRHDDYAKILKKTNDYFLIENNIKSLKYSIKTQSRLSELSYYDIDDATLNYGEFILNNGETINNRRRFYTINHSDFIEYSHIMSGYLNYLISENYPDESKIIGLDINIESVVGNIKINGVIVFVSYDRYLSRNIDRISFSKTI